MLKRFLYISLLCFSATALKAQEQEANLKAVFIYNFINYIDWDTANVNNNFTIGVIGASPVSKQLAQIVRNKMVKNKKIVVREFESPDQIADCQILFIPKEHPFSLHAILERIYRGTLTVSEEEGYAKEGTAFNFVIRDDKLKFEANLKAINMAGLKAGSQLLKLAKIVEQ
jgi:hypothetical protein